MFRWLLKPRFYSKCLSYVKFIKTRLEIIQKRKRAEQKFTKSDIAELLRRGLDYDAYKRADRLLLEQNMLSGYELIEKFIGCISDHLEDLTKQKDCPDECKEAVPSLIYAAKRFGDLPELCDLRTLFTEKFGNFLEPYISKEFVEKFRRDPPTIEMKIRLLYDIAQEFSIEWDDKVLRQRPYTQSSLCEERPKPGGEHTDGRECSTSKGKERDTLPLGRKDFNDDPWIHQSGSDDETSTDLSSHDGHRKGSPSSLGSVSEDEVEIKRPISYWLIPPPYLKEKTNKDSKKTTDSEALPKKESNQNLHEPLVQEKTTLDSGGMKSGKGKAYPSQQPEYDAGQNRRSTTSHVRGTSLPSEPTTTVETSKGHTRTISLETGMRGGAWHVHPNLPDYDDLVARLAALRGR